PGYVWECTWTMLAEDMESIQRKTYDSPGLELSDEQKMNLTLCAIEKLLQRNGTSLKQIPNMPYPDLSVESQSINRLVEDELSYSVPKLNADHSKMLTSKTFVWKTLSAAIRRRHDIVLNVASSGIAALLLPGGRTAHSRFAIPINVNEDSTCCINIESDLAGLIRKTKLIIWDEAPMVHKHCFEALDRTLKDIMRSSKPFGGIVVVFGGDFRQILPVIPRGTRSEIVNASLWYSYIWEDIQVLKLTENMRLCVGNNNGESEETKAFADWILSIGNGEVGEDQDGEAEVEIPNGIIIKDTSGDPIDAIINAIYPDVVANLSTPLHRNIAIWHHT
ncbi:ATP-dependent DNA helicase PIF1-like protein, partial [Tanacetum coccineum]